MAVMVKGVMYAAAAVMSADDNIGHFQFIYGILQYGQAVEVVGGKHIADVAVYKN